MAHSISDAVSLSHLQGDVDIISGWNRFSGSEDEARAFGYLESRLRAIGLVVSRYESDALIGSPGASSLHLLGGSNETLDAFGYALGAASPAGGVTGEMVYVGDAPPEDWERLGVAGKIILSDGIATPIKARFSEATAATGHVHINPEHFYEMCISSVWGSPDADSASMLPSVPAVGVTHDDGQRLKDAFGFGPVRVRLTTSSARYWTTIPTLVGEIGGTEDDSYILFSGHVDSWHRGAMDNATANATQLEVSRILAERRTELRRGVRVAFWSGHSHGRYAGSSWYADTFWQDLFDRCVCHVNIDSLGGRGASDLSHVPTMAETFGLANEVIQSVTGVQPGFTRMSRSSDQSFWGHGIPSLFGTLSEQPDGRADESPAVRGGGGFGWWWHTTEDTADKIDPANLHRDARIYALTLWRLCTDERLPLDYVAAATDVADTLSEYHACGDELFDLQRTEDLARRLSIEFQSLDLELQSGPSWNRLVIAVSRLLVPVVYTRSGPFRQDPALPTPVLPGLSRVSELPSFGADTSARHELLVTLARERNRVEHALISALRMVAAYRHPALPGDRHWRPFGSPF